MAKKASGKKVAIKRIPPGSRCNAILSKRDGYCDIPAKDGKNCRLHAAPNRSTDINDEAKLIFQDALTPNQALELEAFIGDSTSMHGEIGVLKIQLVDEIKINNKAKEDYVAVIAPELTPNIEDFMGDGGAYKAAVSMHQAMISEHRSLYMGSKKRITDLSDKISRAVERNNKVLHGTKFTISVEQLNTIMINQLNIFGNYCKGCPKLSVIAKEIKDIKVKGIGSLPDIGRLAGNMPDKVKKAYREQVRRYREDNIKEVEDAQVEEVE